MHTFYKLSFQRHEMVLGELDRNDFIHGDVIANFPFTLETNANYVVSASLVASGLELAAVDTNHFGLKVFHGVTDPY